MRTYALANEKGGVGKTTTAVNLSAYLAHDHGLRVLLIDFDPQASATISLGVNPLEVEPTVYDVVAPGRGGGERVAPSEAAISTSVQGLDLLPSSLVLAKAEKELVITPGGEYALSKALRGVEGYDVVMVDTPPSLGILTINAFLAAQKVVAPVSSDAFSLISLRLLEDTLTELSEALPSQVAELGGVILTMYRGRTKLSREVEGAIRAYTKQKYGRDLVFRTVIPLNVRAAEAPSHGQPLLLYDPGAPAAEAYRRLAEEFVQREGIS